MEQVSERANAGEPVPGEAVMRGWRTWLPPVLVVVLVGLAIAAFTFEPTQSASVQAIACPPSDSWPAPAAGLPLFTDNNVSEFVGGNYVSQAAAAQSEGLIVVVGNVTIGNGKTGVSRVGTVREGSRVSPTPGSSMLTVGGSVTVRRPSRLNVGSGVPGGGVLSVGGVVTPVAQVNTNGGGIHQHVGSEVIEKYGNFLGNLAVESSALTAQTVTGEAALAGTTLYFTGDGQSSRQVFLVDAASLAPARTIDFKGIPTNAIVTINVVGSSVTMSPDAINEGGVALNAPTSSASANLAAHTLWNFASAGIVRIGGSAPILGAILVASGSLVLDADLDGRLYVGHDLTRTIEATAVANYAWLGASAFACKSEPLAVFTAGQDQSSAPDTTLIWRGVVGGALVAIAIAVLAWWVAMRIRREGKVIGDGDPKRTA